MRLVRDVFVAILLTAAFATLSMEARAADVIKMRLADANMETHLYTQADFYLRDLVKKRSNGRLQIECIYGGALGNEKESVQLLGTGGLEMTDVPPWKASEWVKELDIFVGAFVFRDWDHITRVLTDAKFIAMVNEAIARHKPGFRALYIGASGARQVYNRRGPINNLADYQGIKMRSTGSELSTATWTAMGAHTSPVSWPELYTALQTGVVQGAENSLSGILSKKLYEVAPHVTLTSHNFAANMVLISDSAWKRLPPDLQKILTQAAAETRDWILAKGKASEGKLADNLRSKPGVKVVPGLEDTEKWADRVNSVNAQFAEKIGGKDIFQYIVTH